MSKCTSNWTSNARSCWRSAAGATCWGGRWPSTTASWCRACSTSASPGSSCAAWRCCRASWCTSGTTCSPPTAPPPSSSRVRPTRTSSTTTKYCPAPFSDSFLLIFCKIMFFGGKNRIFCTKNSSAIFNVYSDKVCLC